MLGKEESSDKIIELQEVLLKEGEMFGVNVPKMEDFSEENDLLRVKVVIRRMVLKF